MQALQRSKRNSLVPLLKLLDRVMSVMMDVDDNCKDVELPLLARTRKQGVALAGGKNTSLQLLDFRNLILFD